MQSNPHQIKKLIQISEHSSPMVYCPAQINNETYIVVEQNIKKVEETRTLFYYKYEPAGQQSVSLNHLCDVQNNQRQPESKTTTTCDYEKEVWENVVKALIAALSLSAGKKRNMVNRLLEVIKSFESSDNEEDRMEWDDIHEENEDVNMCPNPGPFTNNDPKKVHFADDINKSSAFSSPYSQNSSLYNKDINFDNNVFQKK